jgi:hypothetical protein
VKMLLLMMKGVLEEVKGLLIFFESVTLRAC